MWVDSHINLHGEKFDADRMDVIQRARESGVGLTVNICCQLHDFQNVLALSEQHEDMYCTIGTHPHDAKDNPDITAADLIKHCDNPNVIGIGETGLDFHYNWSSREEQFHNFEAHVEAAQQTGLPLVIHTREADEDMAAILSRTMKEAPYKALLHCYSSGPELAKTAADLGCWFSLSGIITFKNAHDVRDIAKSLPDDRIMLETDCPYLAPAPYRGRRNEPAWVVHVGEKLAEIKGWTLDDTRDKTTNAFFNCFDKAKRP